MAEAAVPSTLIEIIDDEQEGINFLSTPISSRGLTKSTAISVEQYSEKERDLNVVISVDDDDLQVLEYPLPWNKRPFAGDKCMQYFFSTYFK